MRRSRIASLLQRDAAGQQQIGVIAGEPVEAVARRDGGGVIAGHQQRLDEHDAGERQLRLVFLEDEDAQHHAGDGADDLRQDASEERDPDVPFFIFLLRFTRGF